MQSELNSLSTNKVWTLTDLPKGKKAVGSRWVFKTKTGADGSITRYKARLVARGFSQRYGSDYDETFSPVVRGESVRALLALATQNNMYLHQMDVETAFLNGKLEEEVYMEQPNRHETKGRETQGCKLHKSIYGLKQSPRCWNHVLDDHLKKMEFNQTSSDPCVYVSTRNIGLIIAVYVDDLVLAGKCVSKFAETKEGLSARFKMKDLGRLHHFLGIEIVQNIEKGKVWFGQPTYTRKLLDKFGMRDSKPVSTASDSESKLVKKTDEEEDLDQKLYQAAVGGLLYLSTKTRPDISFAVGNAARFCSNPSRAHWTAVKRIMRYLRGTQDLGLMYCREESIFSCTGYSDADWGGSLDDSKSTSGYVFKSSGAAISWKSQKQTCVALSTAESEYVALSAASQEALWLKRLIGEITGEDTRPMELMEDNQSAICMATNPVFHGRTKHVELKYHFVRDQVTQGHIKLTYCPSERMVADILTKSLPATKFKNLRDCLGITKYPEEEC